MRTSAPTPESVHQERHERWRRNRAAAQTLRSAFPGVERIRVELKFNEAAAPAPGAQSHVMYPPARAFFEFPCPHADCDGRFDLSSVARAVISDAAASADGRLECGGVRPRPGLTKEPCGVRLHYTIIAQHKAGSRSRP